MEAISILVILGLMFEKEKKKFKHQNDLFL